jgi:hypothetical protein
LQLENIIDILQGLTGETTDTIYDLFFTEKRVIAAIVLHHSDLSRIYQKHHLLSIFVGRGPEYLEAKMQAAKLMDERRKTFKGKNLDEILALHGASLEINYDDITSVTVKKEFLATWLEFKVQKPSNRKIKFMLKREQIAEVERVIGKILQSKFLKIT